MARDPQSAIRSPTPDGLLRTPGTRA
ncbi:MAG: hypothetical protein AMXMBFR72_19370, partial [Betaproteobacteria bacterium]